MRLWLLSLLVPTLLFAYTSPGKPTGFVNDFAQIIDSNSKEILEADLRSFAESSEYEITVVTVDTLDGDTVENFAVDLFEEWGIGEATKDTGLLILVAEEEREVRIEVGYGLEPIITDIEASYVISDILVPYFRVGNYGLGLVEAVNSIQANIAGEMELGAYKPEREGETGSLSDYAYSGIILFMILMRFLGSSKSWWFGGVMGGVVGIVIGLFQGFIYTGVVATVFFVLLGLFLDYIASKHAGKDRAKHPWYMGGGGHGGSGGGFGGFGGGSSGGGGASGRW